MVLDRDIASLWARAKRLRDVAETYRTPMSDPLRSMAAELETVAKEAEERANSQQEVRLSSDTLQ
jgi:hypothetical protein